MRKANKLLARLILVALCLPFGAMRPAHAQRLPKRALDIRKAQPAGHDAATPATTTRRQDGTPANVADSQIPSVPHAAVTAATINVSQLPQVDEAALAAMEPRPVHMPKSPKAPMPSGLPVPEGATIFRSEEGAAPATSSTSEPLVSSPTPTASFLASPSSSWYPPDTQGAVGTSHLVAAVNGGFRVQNKSGTALLSTTLVSFFAPVMNGSTDVFDPRVEYDKFNNRWMIVATVDRDSAASAIVVGVSQTGDPTATWYLYRFDADSADSSWADFPMLGYNKDWIVVSLNMFSRSGFTTPFYSRLFVVNKASAYAGTGTAAVITANNLGGSMAPAVTLDASLATEYILQDWNGNANGGYLRLYSITGLVNSPVLNHTSSGRFIYVPSTWDSAAPAGTDLAPQSGTATKIQTNDSRLGNVVYRNGSLWTAHNIFLPAGGAATRTSVQWWEIVPDGSPGPNQFGRLDDPSGANHYAFPSIAVNKDRDVLIGYTKFSSSHYASAAYSYHAASDQSGSLRDPVILKAGEGTYNNSFGGRNRWGDYSGSAVDPTNDTDLWTVQEYATSTNNWSTWWGRVGGSVASCTYSLNITGASFEAAGGTGLVVVGTQAGCPWTATSNASWITITGGTSGSGGGNVNYTVAANTTGSTRTGTMTIAGQTFTVTQTGTTCTFSLSPTSASFNDSGGTGGVTVTTQAGCSWFATSNASWITITGGSGNTGTGAVSYSVNANTSTTSRSGTLTIAGQPFTVNQSGAGASGGLRFYPLPAPVRLLDTRPGEAACFTPGAPIAAGASYWQSVVVSCTGIPSTAVAIAGNLAAVNTLAGSTVGFVTLYPTDVPRPLAANINYMPGQIVNNFFTVGLGANKAFYIHPFTTLHVVVDVTGYYAP